ncbi:type II toxin-antitoxin system HipA family toxin [Nannocystis radixulma]|uniref:Type II toxin-antitoxin system HipA family toxin n=1 Tax=Nannocystis radixulma TaxID=2995305 RepID=A0ABT5B9C4_9BACT|nr:type II toxin-antitoxin system HipA family toxin [Nannocystis radixulma]MDC0670734.1 type II toxin-antitoxin system HipA family toxin [Nannocystis radixulma]
MSIELDVFLHETPVARLVRRDDRQVQLRFLSSYLQMVRRPVLGLYYLDKLKMPLDPESRVPTFFTNLLPDADGPLRALVVSTAGLRDDQEMRLLAHLGEDLPGAVRIRLAAGMEAEEPYPVPPRSLHIDGSRLRFSLAGLQLKFSMVREGKGLVLPASGRGGNWLVKLPDLTFPGVPEAEHAVMQWAGASGIEVPELDLVTFAQLSGIPEIRGATAEAALCLAVRRFDRPTGEPHVHIEDFAQVFGRAPYQKYNEDLSTRMRPLGFETLARVVRTYAPDDRRAFVRRLVFMVLSGNADGHLKNWSFIYPDGRTPRLSPAYDLVPTIAFAGTSDELALPFFGDKAFGAVTLETFGRLAPALQEPSDVLMRWASEDVERIMDAWSSAWGFETEVRASIELHHSSLRRAGLLQR